MTQEEKDLLFKDICARVPYGVICRIKSSFAYEDGRVRHVTEDKILNPNVLSEICDLYSYRELDECKPYLRPMSSMTEEERTELISIITEETSAFGKFIQEGHGLNRDGLHMFWKEKELDWLNKKHFDYRGLIEKGLALEASEGMY